MVYKFSPIYTYRVDGGLGTTGEIVKAEVDKLWDKLLIRANELPFLSLSSKTTLKNSEG